MIIDEITKEVITDPDLDAGILLDSEMPVWYQYILEQAATYQEIVVAEYPETGGKEVEYEEVTPEIGHWEMTDKEGNILPYEISIDTDFLPKDEKLPDTLYFQVYHTYTPEELEEQRKEAEEAERLEKEMREKQETMDAIPGRVDEIESAQDDVILLLADIVGGAA